MRIKSCRICHNKELTTIGSLGKIAISDFTDTPQEGKKYPLELVYCDECTLLQLAHDTPRELLYKHYWYESRLNPVVVADLKEIAGYSIGIESHIDIGGNDGTLLSFSKARLKILVDPSDITPDYKVTYYRDYWENTITFTNFELITAIACLYDLPNPNKFIKKVKQSLAPNGLFISQFQPLEQMIELNDVGNICHEHLEYYSYRSLAYLFEKNGLEIFKVERNTMNGGSYRIFARHFKEGSIKFKEKEYGEKELKDFMKRIEENKNRFRSYAVEREMVGYGASTKANTILQYYDIKQGSIVDVNPQKIGKYMINSKIRIINKIPENIEILWVFPYGFLDYFKKREKEYKGKWVTTIPKFKIS